MLSKIKYVDEDGSSTVVEPPLTSRVHNIKLNIVEDIETNESIPEEIEEEVKEEVKEEVIEKAEEVKEEVKEDVVEKAEEVKEVIKNLEEITIEIKPKGCCVLQ